MADRARQKVTARRDAEVAGRDIVSVTVNTGDAELGAPGMLPRDVPQFTGREDELRRLAALADGGRVVVTVIGGTGGVGKTALAIHAAHQLLPQFPDGQLYADLRGYTEGQAPAEPAEVLDVFLRELGIAPEKIPVDAEERAAMFRGVLAKRRVLVLLDNASSEPQVRPLLPGAGRSLVLVTSRSRLPALEADDRIDLDTLPEKRALELLTRLIGPARVALEPDAVLRVAQWCGRLPLALRIAGQILAAHPKWPVSQFEQMLADERGRLARLQVGDLQVRATFEVSYGQLPKDDARIFRLLGLHFSPDFSAASVAALAGIDVIEAEAPLGRLTEAALVAENGQSRYGMHDLLRLFAHDTCQATDDQATRNAAEERLIRYYAELAEFLDSRINPAQRLAAEQGKGSLPSMREALALAMADRRGFVAATGLASRRRLDELVMQISAHAAYALVILRYLDDVLAIQKDALSAARRSEDVPGQGLCLNNLGEAYRELKRFDQAINCYEQSLAIAREIGDRHLESQTLNNLGNAYEELGREDDAISVHEQALAICREIDDRHIESSILNNLGNAYYKQKHPQMAIKWHQQALTIFREIGYHYGEGHTLNNLGNAYEALGRYHEAINCYEQDIAICQDVGDRYGEGLTLGNLARLYQIMRRRHRAAACFRQAAAAMRDVGEHAEAARWERAASDAEAKSRRWWRRLFKG